MSTTEWILIVSTFLQVGEVTFSTGEVRPVLAEQEIQIPQENQAQCNTNLLKAEAEMRAGIEAGAQPKIIRYTLDCREQTTL